MKRYSLILLILFFVINSLSGQVVKETGSVILFNGIVMDAGKLEPVEGSQIMINRVFISVSDKEGKFAFYVNRGDTVVFNMLGYEPVELQISDTLSGREFIAGIYLNSDTIAIGEVVIVPRLANLKSEIFTSHPETNQIIENAKYNLEVSSYQGRVNQGKLGDPSLNYEVLRQQQKVDAYSKGQIPPDRIAGLSPFMIIPAAYLLMNGLPGKPSPMKPQLTEQEVDQLHRKYLETIRQRE